MASWTSAPASAAERGIVHRGASGDLFDLVRSEVGPALQPFVAHLWEVRWDRCGRPPQNSRTIPFPSVNLTVETGTAGEVRHGHPLPAALLHGVLTRTFDIALTGLQTAKGSQARAFAVTGRRTPSIENDGSRSTTAGTFAMRESPTCASE